MLDRLVRRQLVTVIALSVIGVGIMTSASFALAASDLASKLVGTWRLIHFVDTDAGGKVRYRFGEKPMGYFVYDPTGHLSVQIMRMPATPPFASGVDNKGTDAEVRAAYDGYVAYFGTYRVDEAKGVITHVVEGSLKPSYTGTDQPRPFKLEGDTLIIQGREEDGSAYFRELHRVK
jgi:Lipocalin-like domain